MYVDYNSLPEDSKVWVYPSDRKFYPNEIEEIEGKIKNFIENWNSDDENFKASYQFLYNRFIIFAVDVESYQLTNEDIDISVSFILELQETYHVSLLDKMNVCFKQGEFVQYKELKDFKKLLKNKALTGKSIIFDNLVSNKEDLDNHWELAIEDSWYNRFLRYTHEIRLYYCRIGMCRTKSIALITEHAFFAKYIDFSDRPRSKTAQ